MQMVCSVVDEVPFTMVYNSQGTSSREHVREPIAVIKYHTLTTSHRSPERNHHKDPGHINHTTLAGALGFEPRATDLESVMLAVNTMPLLLLLPEGIEPLRPTTPRI